MDLAKTLQDAKNIYDALPEPVQTNMIMGSVTWFLQCMNLRRVQLFKKVAEIGPSAEEVDEKATSDEQYASRLTRIICTTTQEQNEEKLEAWARLIVLLHTDQLKNNTEFDYTVRHLQECSPVDLLVLGELYKTDELSQAAIKTQEIDGLPEEQVKHSLQRLCNIGLLSPAFDQTGFFGTHGVLNLADLYYVRNKMGQQFVQHIKPRLAEQVSPIVP